MHFSMNLRFLTFAIQNNSYIVGSSLKFCWYGVEHQVSAFYKRCLCLTASGFVSKASTRASYQLEHFKKHALKKKGLDVENCSINIDPTILWPPECVRGMKMLDVAAFNKTISVPVVKVKILYITAVNEILKNFYLRLNGFSSHHKDPNNVDSLCVFINPLSYAGKENAIKSDLTSLCKKLKVEESAVIEYSTEKLQLTYSHWGAKKILRAVIPWECNAVSEFAKVGHIIYLTLENNLKPYKQIIGAVLLDKFSESVTMVVNKVDIINNWDCTFRTFKMEVLAGSGDTLTTVEQNHCKFSFDFAKVHWNPRRCREHKRIIEMLEETDVLYDVMAGVGPFSVSSSAIKKCRVLANDLNPEAYRWLQHNCDLNGVSDRVSCYNMDGYNFIKDVIKQDLLKLFMNPEFKGAIHVTMNLPGIAVEFLPSFVGLMADVENIDKLNVVEPLVHVYMFSRDLKASSCVTRVAYYLGLVDTVPNFDSQFSAALKERLKAKRSLRTDDSECCGAADAELLTFVNTRNTNWLIDKPIDITGLKVKEVRFVTKTAPFQAMVRVSIYITKEILMSSKLLRRNWNQSNDNLNGVSNVNLDACD